MIEVYGIIFFILGGFLYLGTLRKLMEIKRGLTKLRRANEARAKLTLAQQRWRR